MFQQLRQITNSALNISPPAPTPSDPKTQSSRTAPTFNQLFSLNVGNEIDFQQCIPSTVHQRRLGITLKQTQETPRIITMAVHCSDQKLNDLPEYIFGVRKENSYEYFDQFRFKAVQKGTYNFIVGVKTPSISEYAVNARLVLSVEGVRGISEVRLKQQTVLPFVKCVKELVSEEGQRMIKLAVVKNKTKKETKLVFRCSENMNLTLLAQLIGIESENGNEVEVRPKSVQTAGKGAFIISILSNCSGQLSQKKSIRRVLTLRIKDTSCHFHFPIEIAFYPEGQNGGSAE